jgi:riboflavin biosynthesis pyrimidine reductase
MTSASMSPPAKPLEQLLEAARGRDLDAAVMVTSVDGIVAIEGRVGGLTAEADQQLLLGLRERAIAVVVGAATVRAEGYGGLLSATAQQRRAAAGLRAQPELVAISHSADGVAGTPAAHTDDLDLRVEQPPPASDGGPDLHAVSASIRDRHGAGLVVWEGGPTLVRAAVAQGVLGELFLAISPVLVGRGLPLAGAETSGLRRLQLLGTAVSGGFVFLRYGLGPLSKWLAFPRRCLISPPSAWSATRRGHC